MERAAHALNDAKVALYAVDARGIQGALPGLTAISNAESRGPQSAAQLRLQMGRGERVSPDGLLTEQFLAGLTGGLVFYNKSNAIEESIRTAVDDGELTYTLGFYPMEESQDGESHRLRVQGGQTRGRPALQGELPCFEDGGGDERASNAGYSAQGSSGRHSAGVGGRNHAGAGAAWLLAGTRVRRSARCSAGTPERYLGGQGRCDLPDRGFANRPNDHLDGQNSGSATHFRSGKRHRGERFD